jgi:hypothetical protein
LRETLQNLPRLTAVLEAIVDQQLTAKNWTRLDKDLSQSALRLAAGLIKPLGRPSGVGFKGFLTLRRRRAAANGRDGPPGRGGIQCTCSAARQRGTITLLDNPIEKARAKPVVR